MAEESQEPAVRPERFPGWNTDYDLMELVRIIRPILTRVLDPDEGSTKGSVKTDRSILTEGSLLAGKQVVLGSIQTADPTSPLTEASSEDRQVQTLAALSGTPRRNPVLLIWSMATMGALVFMALGFWLMMKTSDYTAIDTFEGAGSIEIQLVVEPGEALPDFTGHLLVEGVHEWNDFVSKDDLIGKNTVMLVWGSGNAQLPYWSRELNNRRLVDFDSSKTQFLGLNLDKSREDALAMLNDDLAGWPHIFNYSEDQQSTYHPMGILGIEQSPLILLIDSTGRLRAKGLKPEEVVEAYRTLFE